MGPSLQDSLAVPSLTLKPYAYWVFFPVVHHMGDPITWDDGLETENSSYTCSWAGHPDQGKDKRGLSREY